MNKKTIPAAIYLFQKIQIKIGIYLFQHQKKKDKHKKGYFYSLLVDEITMGVLSENTITA